MPLTPLSSAALPRTMASDYLALSARAEREPRLVKTKGKNTETGKRVTAAELSPMEILEHEVAGHAGDAVRGVKRGSARNEKNARKKGNQFHEKSGIPFKITNPYVTID